MKNKTLYLVMLAALLAMSAALVACEKTPSDEAPPAAEYTVEFDTAGGGPISPQKVKEGESAKRPDDPVREGYLFVDWLLGEEAYDFSSAVNGDMTLTALWTEEGPATYLVTFESNGGSEVPAAFVSEGAPMTKPENPAREGYYFDGWFKGDDRYDFSAPIAGSFTLTAKWAEKSATDAALTEALAADYSNFTSVSKYTDESGSMTDTFYQTENTARWLPEANALYEEHLVMFGQDGRMLAMYYKHGNEWKKSGLTSYADFVVALYLDEIDEADFEYSEGAYRADENSIDSVVYSLFRSTETYYDLALEVENGRISKVYGTTAYDTEHEQTFYDFGTTEIEIPELPAVEVTVAIKNKDTEAGVAIDKNELVSFAFDVKVDGKAFAVSPDMVDFDDLNADDPAEGTYTLTLSFELWDGVPRTETALLTVKAPQADETFADIFAKDYSNVTITYSASASSTTTYYHKDNLYTYTNSVADFYLFAEADNSFTRYSSNKNFAEEVDQWLAMIRLEMLFDLSPELFVKEGDDDSQVYVVRNVEQLLPILQKTLIMKTNAVNSLRDYSISLEVSAGRISKIITSCYSLANASTKPTTSNGTLRTMTYTLSDFGTTEIEIPDAIKEARGME